MAQNKLLIATILSGGILSYGAVMAATQPSPDVQKPNQQQISADQDFGKLSTDGARAFQDVGLARLAIFDGRIEAAKKYVADADSAFTKAKTDNAVFTKAEVDLKSSGAAKGMTAANTDAAKTGSDKAQPNQAPMNKAVAWLPVDAAMSIDEDFSATPSKAAAVADANNSLRSGDRASAVEKLKLADTDVAITVAVVPVNQTIDDVHQAASLINEGKYYEGSQLLRKVTNSERYDVADVASVPKAQSQASASKPK
ncbi:YfdX family protein [Beijerinckia sp. L45]|uniref:YfdX family protein n=1 Tax=Beijerinckia sp. L45 TaxID=1641855 RepID=UPI00131D5522|nr:YfdX family protein [Beijerinckia sp. L45]